MTGPQPELETPAQHAREAQRVLEHGSNYQLVICRALLAIHGELRELNRTLNKRH